MPVPTSLARSGLVVAVEIGGLERARRVGVDAGRGEAHRQRISERSRGGLGGEARDRVALDADRELRQAAAEHRGALEQIREPERGRPRLRRVSGFERGQRLAEQRPGDFGRLEQQLADPQQSAGRARAVGARDRAVRTLEQHDQILGTQRAQPFERLRGRGIGLGSTHRGRGMTVERVLRERIGRRRRSGLAVGGERLIALAIPREHVTADGVEVGTSGRELERALDHQQGLAGLLLAKERDGQVGRAERVALVELSQTPEGLLGVGGLLVLELRDAEVAQLERLWGDGGTLLREQPAGGQGQDVRRREQPRDAPESLACVAGAPASGSRASAHGGDDTSAPVSRPCVAFARRACGAAADPARLRELTQEL